MAGQHGNRVSSNSFWDDASRNLSSSAIGNIVTMAENVYMGSNTAGLDLAQWQQPSLNNDLLVEHDGSDIIDYLQQVPEPCKAANNRNLKAAA